MWLLCVVENNNVGSCNSIIYITFIYIPVIICTILSNYSLETNKLMLLTATYHCLHIKWQSSMSFTAMY